MLWRIFMARGKLLQMAAQHVLIALPPGQPLAVEILEERLRILAARRERVPQAGDRNGAVPLAERDHGLPGALEGHRAVVDAGTHPHDLTFERKAVEDL